MDESIYPSKSPKIGMNIEVLYQDEYLLVVNKPRNMHVHPTKLSRKELSLQDVLQKEYSMRIFPVHRLDRPVGGVLILAKSSEIASSLSLSMRNREGINKRYLCLVRGWMEGKGRLDRPLRQAPGKPEREAVTLWHALAQAEAPWSDGIFPTSRYTLVECTLETGRYHQIRRHLSVAGHPIIGDVSHGDNPRNRIWLRETNIEGLMLWSYRLSLIHPVSRELLQFSAPVDERFAATVKIFQWEESVALS